ncbi:MAG TPA: GIY-YIG nuclease family protein [Caldithrix abyssi]|uniref:GIY-YIG nuclease family protein n=1 Tax=Caldithrix abyssi TaxID=187145 RepID=A0A7V4UET9_CALAY|nr:GIY-YIG nuclease family protein [Caldithrix abyssi]
MDYYIYILKCSDGSYYTGVTNNIERRLVEHQQGIDPGCYTFKRRPVALVYAESYPEVIYAIQREKQIKGWRRAKKEALIHGQFDQLPELAKRYNLKKR